MNPLGLVRILVSQDVSIRIANLLQRFAIDFSWQQLWWLLLLELNLVLSVGFICFVWLHRNLG